MTAVVVRDGDLTLALKRLKVVFKKDVYPSLQRHKFALSPGEHSRLKSRRARRKIRQREQRREAYAYEPDA